MIEFKMDLPKFDSPRKGLRKIVNDATREFKRSMKEDFVPELQDQMAEGKSPVKGKKWRGYSRSYRESIGKTVKHRKGTSRNARKRARDLRTKRQKPVNLFLSGRLYKSMRTKLIKGGVEVSAKVDYATYVNKARRFLPMGREVFNRKISRFIRDSLSKAVRLSIMRNRRR